MEKTKKESFKSILKTSAYWIIFLFLFYLGIGYFLIPPVVKSKIIKVINNKSDRETTIESVSFNPFTMAFSIEDIVLNDKRRGFVLNCNEFYINLNFLSILKKTLNLKI
ncbi:MAG: hypothetical protein KKF62_16825 [Bacteroidetes bacterium]|nr:hypothetical protein [Bacteroidota bacterium]